MNKEKSVLIISDDENSKTVRMMSRFNLIPIIRRSILSAMEFLRHYEIVAIIIDKEHQNVDAIEFILNARDVARDTPIFVPEQFYEVEDWNLIRIYGKIALYDDMNYPLDNEITKLLNLTNKTI